MRSPKQGYLEKSAVQIDPGFLKLCRKRGRLHSAHKVIYHQGDKVEGFYRVNSGVVMVYKLLQNSQRQISGFFTEGDFFGISGQVEYEETAITVTTSNVTALKIEDVLSNISRPETVSEILCKQVEDAYALITMLKKKSASEKLASFLLMLSDRQHQTETKFDLHLPMSRLDIADYLGLTVETVSRRFTEMKRHGIIALPNRQTVTVLTFDQLKKLSETS